MTSMTILLLLMVSAFLLQVAKEQAEIDEYIKVKKDIIKELLERLGRKNYPVSIDPKTGSVTIEDQILFEIDKSNLSPKGKNFLTSFVPDYTNILMGEPRIRQQVAQILVEGHTDKTGSYDHNMALALDRAHAVSKFIFEGIPTFPHREDLRSVLSANGRSFEDPVVDLKGKYDADASRRVELKFQLKDWELVKFKMPVLLDRGGKP